MHYIKFVPSHWPGEDPQKVKTKRLVRGHPQTTPLRLLRPFLTYHHTELQVPSKFLVPPSGMPMCLVPPCGMPSVQECRAQLRSSPAQRDAASGSLSLSGSISKTLHPTPHMQPQHPRSAASTHQRVQKCPAQRDAGMTSADSIA